MPRWEPGARERLVVAAVDLFTDQGYDQTTVAQIAERAGVTRSTVAGGRRGLGTGAVARRFAGAAASAWGRHPG